MSNIKEYTLVAGGAADTDAFALAQNTTAGTALTLTAAATGATLLATPREVTLTSAANFSAVTFTVVGVDRWGNTITEDITGPNNNTVAGRKVYRSITSITPNGSVASNVEAGYPQRVCSPVPRWRPGQRPDGHRGFGDRLGFAGSVRGGHGR